MPRIKKQKRRITYQLTGTQRKVIEKLAEHGPKSYYALYEKEKVAARSSVWEALEFLRVRQLIEVKKVEERNRKLYGLKFRGLHLALVSKFAAYTDVQQLIKTHNIEAPRLSQAEYDRFLRMSVFFLPFKPFLTALGREGLRKIVQFTAERFAEELFERLSQDLPWEELTHLHPLEPQRGYVYKLLMRSFIILFYIHAKTPRLPESELLDLMGSEAFRTLQEFEKEIQRTRRKYGRILP